MRKLSSGLICGLLAFPCLASGPFVTSIKPMHAERVPVTALQPLPVELGSPVLYADEEELPVNRNPFLNPSLYFEMENGERTILYMGYDTKGDVVDGVIHITGTNQPSLMIDMKQMKGIGFTSLVPQSVGMVKDSEGVSKEMGPDGLVFFGLKDGSDVEVYTLDGIKVRSEKSAGSWTFRSEDYEKGVYIVRIGGFTVKIKN